jgi:hypothetical protein
MKTSLTNLHRRLKDEQIYFGLTGREVDPRPLPPRPVPGGSQVYRPEPRFIGPHDPWLKRLRVRRCARSAAPGWFEVADNEEDSIGSAPAEKWCGATE